MPGLSSNCQPGSSVRHNTGLGGVWENLATQGAISYRVLTSLIERGGGVWDQKDQHILGSGWLVTVLEHLFKKVHKLC